MNPTAPYGPMDPRTPADKDADALIRFNEAVPERWRGQMQADIERGSRSRGGVHGSSGLKRPEPADHGPLE